MQHVGRRGGHAATVGLAATAVGLVILVASRVGPRLRGATPTERAGPLPGDELVSAPTLVATHAITIDAPPATVWPWIAQIGQERAGFYSLAWVENLAGCRIVNADRIHPEWQSPALGDVVRLHPEIGLRIAVLQPGHALVLSSQGAIDARGEQMAGQGFDFSWAFVVRADGEETRLLTRERYAAAGPAGALSTRLGASISTAMTAAMLRGVRTRCAGR